MRLFDASEVRSALPWSDALDALADAFAHRERYRAPERVVLPAPDGGSLLTMPCADEDGWFGVKQVAVLPENPRRGLPGVRAWYTLMDPSGAPVLGCDATELTRQRTAGVSALAAGALAAAAAETLLVVGSGGLAPWMAWAHLRVRAYRRVVLWARDPARARGALERLEAGLDPDRPRPELALAPSLEGAVRQADVISVATTAREPLIRGAWLRPGQHLDVVGAFLPSMAEADADAVARCRVFVDDRAAARAEAGDLIRAADDGWSWDALVGDLREVLVGTVRGGSGPTLFKSVGLAFEDLALARRLAARA